MTTSRPVWRVTQAPRVVEQDAFASCLDWELQKASRLAYCVSVVSMVDDPVEQGPHGSLTALAEDMAARVRATDLAAVIPARYPALLPVHPPTHSHLTILAP